MRMTVTDKIVMALEQGRKRLGSEVIMRHRQPKDSMLPPLARDQLVAELRRARDSVIAAQNELRRQAPLSRALDSLMIDIDDIAFLLTGNRFAAGIAAFRKSAAHRHRPPRYVAETSRDISRK
jgi:hypothetical protein